MSSGIQELRKLMEQANAKPKKQQIRYEDVQIEHSAKTNKIVLPEGCGLLKGADLLRMEHEQQSQEVALNITIPAFPLDGAVALARVMQRTFGWTNMVPTPGFFGSDPPVMIEVEVGPGETAQVHWGRMTIPGIEGYLETGIERSGNRTLFCIRGEVLRMYEPLIHRLADAVREEVKENSIYRGKAIRISFRDDDGQPKNFRPTDCPRFIDTSTVNPEELILPDSVMDQVEDSLFTPIRYPVACGQVNVPPKRGILLEGPYGVGKTFIAYVSAALCVDYGVTFIYLEDVRDIDKGLAFAELYGRCLLFSEDIDRVVRGERDSDMDRIFNILDGVAQKNSEILTVLTTNDVEAIAQGCIRQGRIDDIISIPHPDAKAGARMVISYGRGLVDGSIEAIGEAIKPLLNNNAAAFRECVERSKLSAVRRLKGKVDNLRITPKDLSVAAKSMARHIELLQPREVESTNPMDIFGRGVGREISRELARGIAQGKAKNAEGQ